MLTQCRLLTVLFAVSLFAIEIDAGQFLLDFNDQEGGAAGWDVFPRLVKDTVYPLTDKSGSGDNDVTLTSIDDNFNPNNPAPPRAGAVYDGITVPQQAVDDYLFKENDAAGTSARIRIDNLNPGPYRVTVFEGRTTDASQFAKIWAGDTSGGSEPANENTGSFANGGATVSLVVDAGQTLWYRHLEDNSGGVSGMIINPVPEPAGAMLLAIFAAVVAERCRRCRLLS